MAKKKKVYIWVKELDSQLSQLDRWSAGRYGWKKKMETDYKESS